MGGALFEDVALGFGNVRMVVLLGKGGGGGGEMYAVLFQMVRSEGAPQ